MRVLWCLVLTVAASLGAGAQTAAPPVYPADMALGAKVQALLADPVAARAHWGIAVTRLDGTPIFGMDEGKLFRPASTAKLFTTAAAMALLGSESRVRTRVTMVSLKQNPPGTFDGLISIEGDGDAYLSARTVPYASAEKIKLADRGEATAAKLNPLQFIEDTASAIAATGVKTVEGTISGNDSVWNGSAYNETWSLEDTPWGYGAPVSALSINDNQLALTLVPGKDILGGTGDYQASATLYPDTGYYTLKVAVDTVSGRPAEVSVNHADGPNTLNVYGHIPPGAPYTTEIAIDDPPRFAAEALKAALIRRGIAVEAKIDGDAFVPGGNNVPERSFLGDLHRTNAPPEELYHEEEQMCAGAGPSCSMVKEHVSPTLRDDVVWTLKNSLNLHAELMLRRLGFGFGAEGSAANGVWALGQFLRLRAHIDRVDFDFYDGSGLSAKDLVAPRAEAELLVYAATQPWFAQWKAALPVGGVDGTLRGRFTEAPLKGHVFAKTGTLGESRALAGYLDCASGRQVVFSIMVDNHPPESSVDKDVMDKIVAAIAAAE